MYPARAIAQSARVLTDAGVAIGVPYYEMKDYLEFLFNAENGSFTGAFEIDSFAILAFSWSEVSGVALVRVESEDSRKKFGISLRKAHG